MPKVKVPKKIAGVKVPKKLRKEAKKALNLTDSAVRDLALAGLTAAAENLLNRAQAGRTAGAAARAAVAEANLKALDLGDVLRAAAIEGARRFLDGFEEAQRASTNPAPVTTAKRAKSAAAAKPAAARAKSAAKTAKPAAKAARPTAKTAEPAATAARPAAKPKKPAAKPRARKASGRAAAAR